MQALPNCPYVRYFPSLPRLWRYVFPPFHCLATERQLRIPTTSETSHILSVAINAALASSLLCFVSIVRLLESVARFFGDHYSSGGNCYVACFTCGLCHPQNPSKKVTLIVDRLLLWASVDMEDLSNLFVSLKDTADREVWLCTPCRDRQKR